MYLSWDHFNFILQAKTHLSPQKQQFGYVGFQEKFDSPPLNPSKTEPNHTPPGQRVMSTDLLPVIAPRIEPGYMHFR